MFLEPDSGIGTTTALAISAICTVDPHKAFTQVVFVAYMHEAAMQVYEKIAYFGKRLDVSVAFATTLNDGIFIFNLKISIVSFCVNLII